MAYEDRDALIFSIREERNHKLTLSDIDMLRAVEEAASFSAFATVRADWVAYRQALRDHMESIPDPLADDLSDLPAMPLSPNEQPQEV